jgi:hypothetical protein
LLNGSWRNSDEFGDVQRLENAFMKPTLLAAAFVALALGACGGIPKRETDQEALERYLQYAGEPVDSVSYLGDFDGWRALGRDKLVVWLGINEAYLLSIAGPCSDLPFATRIGIKTRGPTLGRGDYVLVRRGERCLITEVRPVDYRKMKQDRRKTEE